ncbi:universal stress protein [Variovorax sp. PBL-E5]|uniref:universal stress protein n=1 Tax=Variovorax sp. PBL-E5 TaxID=434014 RepID=UPI00131957A2|nr:universal stress protein [Variovorax sp. PBL-E5]VTU46158.1 Putative universal stress protein [Variovorax sp. PBL-E5]
MFKRILVATDGSALSEQAVAKAIELSLLTGAELLAVTVAHLEAHSYFEGLTVLNQRETEEAQHRLTAAAQNTVDAVKAAALAKGVCNAEAVVIKSNLVAESIVDLAKARACDLIVMASRGRRGVTRLLMGSETLHVLTHTHTPVLVLR